MANTESKFYTNVYKTKKIIDAILIRYVLDIRINF